MKTKLSPELVREMYVDAKAKAVLLLGVALTAGAAANVVVNHQAALLGLTPLEVLALGAAASALAKRTGLI